MSWTTISRQFDRFLFESCDPRFCPLFRILISLNLVVITIVWMLDAQLWFTDDGVLRAETSWEMSLKNQLSVLYLFPSTTTVVSTFLGILLFQSLLMLVGCWSRVQAMCIYIWLTSFHHRNPIICDGEDTVLRLFVFFMIFMPLDCRWSLLRRILKPNHPPQPLSYASGWALRLVQLELTAIYFSTAWCKAHGSTWQDGTALYYVSRMQDVFGRLWLPGGMWEMLWLVKMLTWGVLIAEMILPFALWLRPTRRLAVGLGLFLHLSIEYAMNLFMFEWIMMAGLITFLAIKPLPHSRDPEPLTI
jgi:Vitamin K-dependent gamma-carboxylase